MDMQAVRSVLLDEARELLAEMEQALLAIETQGADGERINAIFRAAHTLKGSSGMFNLQLVVDFTHLMENLLVQVRTGEQPIDAPRVSLLLNCGDYLSRLFDNVADGREDEDPDPVTRARLCAELGDYLEGVQLQTVSDDLAAQNAEGATHWRITLRPQPQVFAHGLDPIPFVQYLADMGQVLDLQVLQESLPLLSELDPESCYLGFELELQAQVERSAIEQALEFIEQDCDIQIQALDDSQDVFIEEERLALADYTERTGALDATETIRNRSSEQVFIKVDARKLDELINAVGELVIRNSACNSHPAINQDPDLSELLEDVGQLVEQIRDRALNLRMVPIGEVFQRFPRVVRDVCKELGKRIELKINGADTELDKSMVEKLNDPLLHIVRNAMDHGIEPIEQRLAAGKPEQGVLALNAYHQSGSVVIEISDDGRGLNTERILRKAIERGLVEPEAQLAERDIYNLIFAPGFSTAEKVTDLSGRGVGMDVVRQNIEQLRGTVDIQSTPGKGSTFRIQLPLTLAIIDGFQVAVGDADFVLPLDLVVECLEFHEQNGNDVFSLRGQPLPYLRLAERFDISRKPGARECLVVVQCGDQRAGIVVDRFVGEIQAVIKPLGNLLSGMRGFSGSTILGDGSVALLLDIPALVSSAN
ncbi:chemotaxis protein CheA [Pseudomonas saudiphocaensis]|uniref:Chemotaxis protein CheA n=1 Tax=Pseudomonas saudiphocaensis TaxID=1499686 RepID=A0A078LPK9_9PSED|nr:chemotaxis protein CheA [Pseudomonas saudiphocaensis]CDZ93270.1 putative chemotaxis two-component system sensor histidine kinase protein [Pseudomonas saudiphocaensis]